jgi:hypothetical protein
VVAVLNHVLAAEAVFISNLCHKNSSLLLCCAPANLKSIGTFSVQCRPVQRVLLC